MASDQAPGHSEGVEGSGSGSERRSHPTPTPTQSPLPAPIPRESDPSAPLRIAALPGDGIGPEVMAQALLVLEALADSHGFSARVDEIPCGGEHFLKTGTEWPSDAPRRCAAADLILLGAIGKPDPKTRRTVCRPDGHLAGYEAVIGNRRRLDLFANLRPIRGRRGMHPRIHGTPTRVWDPQAVDLLVVRENLEGLYSEAGHPARGEKGAFVACDERIISEANIRRLVREALACVERRNGAPGDGRPRITALVKDNVLHGCRLFRAVFEDEITAHPDLDAECILIDAFGPRLFSEPERFDVVVTSNLFGDIASDWASPLAGGLGVAPSLNLGPAHLMAEPVHGSAPDIAGKDRANPIGMLLALALGLEELGRRHGRTEWCEAAARLDTVITRHAAHGGALTRDLSPCGEGVSTSAFGRLIAQACRS